MDSLFYGAANCSSNTVDKNSENKQTCFNATFKQYTASNASRYPLTNENKTKAQTVANPLSAGHSLH